MLDLSFSCDMCGAKKGEDAHWWMVILEKQSCYEPGQPDKGFMLIPWNREQCRSGDLFHLCGQNCAMQAMERFMTHGTLVIDPVAERIA